MKENQKNQEVEEISTYNTFKVFENIYRDDRGKEDYWQIKAPVQRRGMGTASRFLIFVFILSVLGLGVYPILAYFLKTPYPLIVVAEDNLAPVVEKNDLVLVRGVIDKTEIKPNDLVVYASDLGDNFNLLVQKVVDINRDKGLLMVKGEAEGSAGEAVEMQQVMGKVVGESKPFRVPLMGRLIGYLAGR